MLLLLLFVLRLLGFFVAVLPESPSLLVHVLRFEELFGSGVTGTDPNFKPTESEGEGLGKLIFWFAFDKLWPRTVEDFWIFTVLL